MSEQDLIRSIKVIVGILAIVGLLAIGSCVKKMSGDNHPDSYYFSR